LFPAAGETELSSDWEAAIDAAVARAIDGLTEALARRR